MNRTSTSFVFLTAVAVLVLVSFGCSGGEQQRKVHTLELQAKPSPWKMSLSTDPAQPMYGQDTVFRVTLKDDAGKQVTGVKVEADLKMKTMDMGKTIVSLVDNGQGIYEGKGKFSMAGPWDVIVTATKDGKGGMQTFTVLARKD